MLPVLWIKKLKYGYKKSFPFGKLFLSKQIFYYLFVKEVKALARGEPVMFPVQ